MKKINKYRLCSLTIIGLFIMLTYSCKKDDNNSIPAQVTDIDSNVYHTVKIGNQEWLVENLNVTHYRNGDPIPNITDSAEWSKLKTGAYCNYQNNSIYSDTFGKLYNWYAVNDNRNIAPLGWHIPTDAEWTLLMLYLGGDSISGGKLKEIGVTHWTVPNEGATNITGFTALPGGFRNFAGQFANIRNFWWWWSSTECLPNVAYFRCMLYYISKVDRNFYEKGSGYSVRCIKDN